MCSFTDKDEGYATNQVQVAKDLYEALRQFFLVFTEVQQSDFYITGESYAGIASFLYVLCTPVVILKNFVFD